MDYDKKADIKIPDWVKRGLPTAQFGKPLLEPARDAQELATKCRIGAYYADWVGFEITLDEASAEIERYVQARIAAQGIPAHCCATCGRTPTGDAADCTKPDEGDCIYPIFADWISRRLAARGQEGAEPRGDYTPEQWAKYRRVMAWARSELGTNTALDILYRMGYLEACKDHSRALARAEKAEADCKKAMEASQAEVNALVAKLERVESEAKALRGALINAGSF